MWESRLDPPLRTGLIYEVRKIAEEVGLPDPSKHFLSSEAVRSAVKEAARMEMWRSITASKNVKMMVKASRFQPEYIYKQNMSNWEQLLWLLHRLGCLNFKSRYSHMYSNTECVFLGCGETDSWSHSLVCVKNPIRRPKEENMMDTLRYIKELHHLRVELVGRGLYDI